MKNLKILREAYKNAPKMRNAIDLAIAKHGEDAEAVIAHGNPSKWSGSNCFKTAKSVGFADYEVFPGPRRRYRTQGFINILVRVK